MNRTQDIASRETAGRPRPESLIALKRAVLDRSYISIGTRRTKSVHEYYRYPARFTPDFSHAAIEAFSDPGDLVVDPFVGGGTTAVEARLNARDFIGSDLNSLAVFVSGAKTTIHTDDSIADVREWAARVPDSVRLNRRYVPDAFWRDEGYLRNVSDVDTWRLRNIIGISIDTLSTVEAGPGRSLARCAILRTAQWALDMRKELPHVSDFRRALLSNAEGMAVAASEFAASVTQSDLLLGRAASCALLHEGLPGLSLHPTATAASTPRLILTSPPYPGVYMLYHRWKVRGRRESSAPFWVANTLDGNGQSYYTMAARNDPGRNAYFERLRAAYADLVKLADRSTWFVQLVGFNAPNQMPRYLDAMSSVGLVEERFDEAATDRDGRLWRDVPGRRWWVTSSSNTEVAPETAREVVLFHRLRR